MEENKDDNKLESLEGSQSENGQADGAAVATEDGSSSGQKSDSLKKTGSKLKSLISRLNIYLLIFILVVLIAAFIVFISLQRSQNQSAEDAFGTKPLTQEELEELQNSEIKVGDPKQTLGIESNAIFSGKVLIRDSLDVAGTIKVGGSLSLPGITVSGASNFDQITANNLSISGDTAIQGQLNVQSNLAVTGTASFGGIVSAPQINIDRLQISQDLQLNRHIDAGGATPGVSAGSSIGGGGTVSVSGTDTAGTVAVNAGGGAGNGPVVTINFAEPFTQTPHVVITPVGRAVNYYITRTTTSFTIYVSGSLSPGSFAFDYIAID